MTESQTLDDATASMIEKRLRDTVDARRRDESPAPERPAQR